jgi:hypothetical protein
MGRRKRRPSSSTPVEPDKVAAWRDLVIFTALLLGAEFQERRPKYWVTNDDIAYGWSRFICARQWLWRKGMSVRRDGSIYQVPSSFLNPHKPRDAYLTE